MRNLFLIVLLCTSLTSIAVAQNLESRNIPGKPLVVNPHPALDTLPAHQFSVLHVPRQFATIQEALDVANSGWTILVAPGTYLENLIYRGKSVTLRSDADGDWRTHDPAPATTMIDGNQVGPVVKFEQEETPDAIIEGFTITNGATVGIDCGSRASPTIRGNRIIDNQSWGIHGWSRCNSLIENNLVSGHLASGIYTDSNSEPNIRGNTIINNNSGIHIYMTPSSLISGNIIAQNSGRGIALGDANCRIEHNYITGNEGGISVNSGDPQIVNNLIAYNHSSSYGGGISIGPFTRGDCINNTVIGNTATYGGAISGIDKAWFTVENCILWDNQASLGSAIYLEDSITRCDIDHCDIEGGIGSIYQDPGTILNYGAGSLSLDPLFISGPQGDHYLSQVAAGQGADSPCLDAGGIMVDASDLTGFWTRTDETPDTVILDIGFHYGPEIGWSE